jgi:hypothetical protein
MAESAREDEAAHEEICAEIFDARMNGVIESDLR